MIGALKYERKYESLVSFNPCKGFGVIGAAVAADTSVGTCFNPCKGFGVIGAIILIAVG